MGVRDATRRPLGEKLPRGVVLLMAIAVVLLALGLHGGMAVLHVARPAAGGAASAGEESLEGDVMGTSEGPVGDGAYGSPPRVEEGQASGPGPTDGREEVGEGHLEGMGTYMRLLGQGASTALVSGDATAAAGAVLTGYREQGGCVLVRSGYLDLSGRMWACVVQGDGWVEVTVVRQRMETDESEVTYVRMDADLWAQEIAQVQDEAG